MKVLWKHQKNIRNARLYCISTQKCAKHSHGNHKDYKLVNRLCLKLVTTQKDADAKRRE